MQNLPFCNMANSAMFNDTFTLTCVKQESMSQAIYRLAGKFTLGIMLCTGGLQIIFLYSEYI